MSKIRVFFSIGMSVMVLLSGKSGSGSRTMR